MEEPGTFSFCASAASLPSASLCALMVARCSAPLAVSSTPRLSLLRRLRSGADPKLSLLRRRVPPEF